MVLPPCVTLSDTMPSFHSLFHHSNSAPIVLVLMVDLVQASYSGESRTRHELLATCMVGINNQPTEVIVIATWLGTHWVGLPPWHIHGKNSNHIPYWMWSCQCLGWAGQTTWFKLTCCQQDNGKVLQSVLHVAWLLNVKQGLTSWLWCESVPFDISAQYHLMCWLKIDGKASRIGIVSAASSRVVQLWKDPLFRFVYFQIKNTSWEMSRRSQQQPFGCTYLLNLIAYAGTPSVTAGYRVKRSWRPLDRILSVPTWMVSGLVIKNLSIFIRRRVLLRVSFDVVFTVVLKPFFLTYMYTS